MQKHRSIIDTDIHSGIDNDRILDFLPEPWRTRYADGNRGSQPIGYWNPHGVMRPDAVLEDGSRIEASPRGLAHHFLDVYGIEYGILNSGNLHLALSPEPDFAAAVTSAGNDVVAHDWLTADPRYRSSLTVSPLDPALAAKEIHRLGDHPGFVQVLLPSAARMPYGQRYYHPIYAAAVEHNLPVAIHPGTEGTGVSGSPTAAGYPSSYFEWHTGLVGSYMAHLVSLISEGVFTKFPTLKFVLIEGGVFWIPPLLWRFDKNWKSLRMTAPWVDRLPSEIARDHILVTTQPLEEPPEPRHFAMMLEMFDVGRMLMFSSDYPHWDGDTPDFAMRHFPPELRPRVMSETARELYRLPRAPAAQPDVSIAADVAEAPHA
ncbi:MAG TPA: amidohydrolase family protein [Herpetosiphonaceae bacterium]|nr:amidohydrolase family protein [Herpetosiphonaceae bacterium]